jgi:hypothetical protein
MGGGDGIAGGEGMSGTGISTVPLPSVVSAGDSGAGVAGDTGVSTVVSIDVVTEVVVVVVVVVSESPESFPLHAVSNAATAIPEASANNFDFDAPHEVMEQRLTRRVGG